MANLRDRVKVAVPSGQGAQQFITLGAAVPGFRTFASAYTTDALVTYVIEDGTAWEVGRGNYSAGDNSFNRGTVDASSNAGSRIDMGSTATLSVTYLSADHIPDWPYFEIANNNGNGSDLAGYFPTMTFGNLPAIRDTHGGWNAAGGYYTIPQTGVYDILYKFRLPDDTTNGQSYGLGVDTANGDSAFFSWYETGSARRKGAIYSAVRSFNAGNQVRAFLYCDGTVGANGYTSSSMTMMRVR